MCCETACSGTCEACIGTLKQSGLGDGTCGPIKDGSDPSDECAPSGVLCGADGQCNGTGACRPLTPSGVSCSTDGKICDGSGVCALPPAGCAGDHIARKADGTTQDCTPYKCDSNGTCRAAPPEGVGCTSADDCVAPTLCNPSGACVAPSDETSSGCSVTSSARAISEPEPGPLSLVLLGAVAALSYRRRNRAGREL